MGRKLLWLSVAGLLASVGLFVVVLGYVGLVAASAIATGAPVVATLFELAFPYLPILAVLFVAGVVSGVGLVWALVRQASEFHSERLRRLAERAEYEYSPLRALGLSDLFAPPEPSPEEQAEDALASLKRQYVDGDISELEFERKVDRLVSNESIDEARAERERREVLDERSGRY